MNAPHDIQKFSDTFWSQIYRFVLKPRSTYSYGIRQELFLNISLLGIGILSMISAFYGTALPRTAIPPSIEIVFAIIPFIFFFYYIIARFKYQKIIVYFFMSTVSIYSILELYYFGMTLPTTLPYFILSIGLSSKILRTKAMIIFNLILIGSYCLIAVLQQQPTASISEHTGLLLFTTIIASLYTSQFMVATRQVHTLQEKIVEERRSNRSKIREEIDKIKQIKLEKFDQLYHLVEFGRLSASFFHDLMSPLTHLNLEISQWAKLAQSEQKVVIEALPKVIESSKRIERIIISAKKYIQSKEQSQYFSVDSELYAAIDSLDYRAKQQGVDILVYADKEISSYGNQLKFNHVITNIIANAIDAYQPLPTNRRPFAVYCNLHQEDHTIVLSVTDYGCGIPADALEHIFDPFFTTKSSNLGSGIGLSSAKHIIEKCFHGNISIRSMVNHGTTFTIAIPHERLPALSASV